MGVLLSRASPAGIERKIANRYSFLYFACSHPGHRCELSTIERCECVRFTAYFYTMVNGPRRQAWERYYLTYKYLVYLSNIAELRLVLRAKK